MSRRRKREKKEKTWKERGDSGLEKSDKTEFIYRHPESMKFTTVTLYSNVI